MSDTLDYLLAPIQHWLNDPATEDVAIQDPGRAWVFAHGRFTCHPVAMTAEAIENLIIVAAAQRRQDVNTSRPLALIDMRGGYRLAATVHPCVEEGKPAITVRRQSANWPELDKLTVEGLFRNVRTRPAQVQNPDMVALLREAREQHDEQTHGRLINAFLRTAVQRGMNIILAGDNGSGKTHLSKSLIGAMDPELRIITIQDSEELKDMPHPNWVSFYCAKHGVSQAELVQHALRYRIGRLFLQEIRDGDSAIALLHGLQTGHRGAISTIHATDCASVFARLRYQIKSSTSGAMLDKEDIDEQLEALIDVVVHCSRPGGVFSVDEVWFREAP